jgi:hypothetical protein
MNGCDPGTASFPRRTVSPRTLAPVMARPDLHVRRGARDMAPCLRCPRIVVTYPTRAIGRVLDRARPSSVDNGHRLSL